MCQNRLLFRQIVPKHAICRRFDGHGGENDLPPVISTTRPAALSGNIGLGAPSRARSNTEWPREYECDPEEQASIDTTHGVGSQHHGENAGTHQRTSEDANTSAVSQ